MRAALFWEQFAEAMVRQLVRAKPGHPFLIITDTSEDVTQAEACLAAGIRAGAATQLVVKPRATERKPQKLGQYGVKVITGANVGALTDRGVMVDIGGRQQMVGGFSSIVLALGSKPTDELAEQLGSVVEEVYVVGDARQAARVVDATAQAAEVALKI